jgi:malate dehydrogenase
MSLVAVLGAGDLGGACAQAVAARDRVSHVRLIDAARSVAAGKALDIQQSGAIDVSHCQLSATDDFTAVSGAAVCVIADKFASPSMEWQGDEALGMLERVLPYLAGAPVVFAGASHADLMTRVGTDLKDGSDRIRRDRLLGSAAEAYASAIRSIVALEARSSPGDVTLAVLGVPPRGFVIPWSEASIAGYALERVLGQVEITRIEARAARLWPPGPYTLGLAAAHVAEAIITSSRRTFSVLTMLGGEFGVRNRCGALPVLLSAAGIVEVRMPSLNTRERIQVENVLGSGL